MGEHDFEALMVLAELNINAIVAAARAFTAKTLAVSTRITTWRYFRKINLFAFASVYSWVYFFVYFCGVSESLISIGA